MASRVLLVDDELDSLAPFVACLRERGIHVHLASSVDAACECARKERFDVVLATRRVTEPTNGSMGVSDAMSIELAEAPPLVVLLTGDDSARIGNLEHRVHADDIEGVVQRIARLTKTDDEGASSEARGRTRTAKGGKIEETSLADRMMALVAERRSGTLTVTTPRGAGEIRFVTGEIVDVVYIRLEGEKALTRMFEVRDGVATFTPGSPAIMRRIYADSLALVVAAKELADKSSQLRRRATALANGALLAIDGSFAGLSELEQQILTRLRVPATLEDLLEDLPHTDVAILEALLHLDACARIKPLGHSSSRVHICGPEQLHQLQASTSHAKRAGYAGAARVVFAATPSRLAVFGHTLLSLADVFPPRETIPSIPVPHGLATLRLGDGVELDLVGLPLVPVYAPLWPMALAGASMIVRLDEAALPLLTDAGGAARVSILDARTVVGAVEESSAVQAAILIKAALDMSTARPD